MKFFIILLLFLTTNIFGQKKYQLYQLTQSSYKCYNTYALLIIENGETESKIEVTYYPNYVLKSESSDNSDNYKIIFKGPKLYQTRNKNSVHSSSVYKLKTDYISGYFDNNLSTAELEFPNDFSWVKLQLPIFVNNSHQEIIAYPIIETDNVEEIKNYSIPPINNSNNPNYKGKLDNSVNSYLKYFNSYNCDALVFDKKYNKLFNISKKITVNPSLKNFLVINSDGEISLEGRYEFSAQSVIKKNEFDTIEDKSIENFILSSSRNLNLGNVHFVKIGNVLISNYSNKDKVFYINYDRGYIRQSIWHSKYENEFSDLFIPNYEDFETIEIEREQAIKLVNDTLKNNKGFFGLAYLIELHSNESHLIYAIDLYDNEELKGKPIYTLNNKLYFPNYNKDYFGKVSSVINQIRNLPDREDYLPFYYAFNKIDLPNGDFIFCNKGECEDKLIKFISEGGKINVLDKNADWLNFADPFFKSGNTELTSFGISKISNINKILKAFPNVVIKIGCYSDNTGSEEANLKLTQARAKKVKELLISATGLQIKSSKGYGIINPITCNETQDGRFYNRRVAIKVSQY